MISNKHINSKCICCSGLNYKKNILMLIPCEHILHINCYQFYINNISHSLCPICYSNISDTITIHSKNINKQQYIDLLSMTNYNDYSNISMSLFFDNLVNFSSIFSSIPFLNNINDGKNLCERIFTMNNIDIIVTGSNNIIHDKKIFIANHTCYLDMLIIFYILNTGFLASSFTNETPIGRKFLSILPCLVIKRGHSTNTVNAITDYVNTNGSICIFPEGMLTHPDTIIQFRTGAFHAGFPIYSIIIKYKPLISDTTIFTFLTKLASQINIKIYVDIIGPYYGPFNTEKIETIRSNMANVGKLYLSRVSTKDLTDK